MTKPPYRVPSMAEIAGITSNGLKVVSTFSGAGGSCLGYKMAGFEVVWANDFHPNAVETYRRNHPRTILDDRNIRAVKPSEILEATGLKVGEIDLFDGSPPCQSFSTAGAREKKWGTLQTYSDGTTQRNDDLFFEYTRLLRGLQPRAFIAENVSGLVKGIAKGYFVEIFRELEACGYNVEAKLLDAQWLGVPQTRQRVIFMGTRKDLAIRPAFPEPLPYRYGVADACPWLAETRTHNSWVGSDSDRAPTKPVGAITAHVGGNGVRMIVGNDAFVPKFGSTAGPTPTLCATIGNTAGAIVLHDTGGKFSSKVVDANGQVPAITVGTNAMNSGHYATAGKQPADLGIDDIDREEVRITESLQRKWSALHVGGQGRRKNGGGSDLRRVKPSAPSPMVPALCRNGMDQMLPPFVARRFTILEAKRLCSFPDDFQLLGSYEDRWARLGNSVPPLMMAAIARVVAPLLASR